MMRIVMPSIVDPEFAIGGAWTVTRALLGLLREGPVQAEVEVVAVTRRSPMGHRFRQSVAVARSLVSGLPSKIEFTRTRAMLSGVLAACRRPTDLIVINGADLAWLLPHLPAAANRVMIAHNIEHQVLESQIPGFLDKAVTGPLLRRDLRKLRAFELESLRRAGNLIFLSSLDAEYARVHCPEVRSIVVPPVFEGSPAARRRRSPVERSFHIGMLANFEWWPNREGLAWFLDRVFPHISSGIQLHLFGNRSRQLAPLHPRIRPHGYAASLSEVWNACDVIISPVFSGGGVCVKVAEAIYHGMPLLASRFAVRGLPLDPDPSIVLLDRPEDWIGFLNSGVGALAAQTVPRFIADRFSADAHRRQLSEFLVHSL
jgi:glycosyltransferase involved in cell wall biosynthesis